jgi:hypothetical protein
MILWNFTEKGLAAAATRENSMMKSGDFSFTPSGLAAAAATTFY